MDLSPEDDLRLNVLLANDVHAIRIDESKLHLHALTASGETTLKLNPNTRPERYLKHVRELLSSHFLDSPAGYPIYLRRWTRMGDITASNLENLLKIGEPEAVIAAVRSPNLTETVAARAWWAMPNSDNARRMLDCPTVAGAPIADELSAFLIEFLPYEERPTDMIESVRLILSAGLADLDTRRKLWKSGARKAAIRVGFLLGDPSTLVDVLEGAPEAGPEPSGAQVLGAVSDRVRSAAGQAFIAAARDILKQFNNPETVSALLEAIGDFFNNDIQLDEACKRDVLALDEQATTLAASLADRAAPCDQLAALIFLGGVRDDLVIPVFANSDAVGRVMRRQIEHITTRIDHHLSALC